MRQRCVTFLFRSVCFMAEMQAPDFVLRLLSTWFFLELEGGPGTCGSQGKQRC